MVFESLKKPTLKKDIKRFSFWDELEFVDLSTIKYNPYGSASIAIPTFYRDTIEQNIQNIPIGDFQYTECHGSLEIRTAIVDNFSKLAHLKDMNPETNVSVSNGATLVISQIIESLIASKSDEGVHFEPYYPGHFKGFYNKGIVRVSPMVFNFEKEIYEFNFKDFESKLNESTRVVILCNPGNPTSRVATVEEYARLSIILDKYPQIQVIEDCAYAVYLNKNINITYFHELANNFQKTYTVFSCGKIFNTTGNRIGFCFSSPELIKKFNYYLSDKNPPGAMDQKFYKFSLEAALLPYAERPTFWDYASEDVMHRVDYVVQGLAKLGVKTYKCEGSYYLTMDATFLATKVEKKYYLTLGDNKVFESYRDRAVCRKLILESQVALIPFSGLTVLEISTNDEFVRLVCNRNYAELDILLEAVEKIVSAKSEEEHEDQEKK